MLISFIVPLFNNERYIKECIDSILAISGYINDFEIIVINDGSTDTSLEVLINNYKSNNHVIIIDKINEGVAITRNLGVSKAKGKYLSFIDSDDYIDAEKFFSVLIDMVDNNLDVIMTNQAIVVSPDNHFIEDGKDSILSKSIFRSSANVYQGFDFLSISTFNDGVVNAIINREFWKINKFQFGNFTHLEDLQIMFNLIYNSNRFKSVPVTFYYRRLSENSSTRHNDSKKYISAIKSMKRVLAYLQSFIDADNKLSINGRYILKQKVNSYVFELLMQLTKIDVNRHFAADYLTHLKKENLYPTTFNFYKAMPMKSKFAYFIKYKESLFLKNFREDSVSNKLTVKELI